MITSAEQFVSLRESLEPADYNRAANDNATDEIWLEVLSEYPHMAFWVALNKTISESMIRRLSESNDSKARFAIAMKRKTPEDVLASLASDYDDSVRMAVARNPKCSIPILNFLISDPWEAIRIFARSRVGGATAEPRSL